MRRRNDTVGAYGITSKGIDSSAPSLGAAISKALTFANRIQLKGELEEGDVQSIYVRRLGGDTAARVDVRHGLIEVFATAASR